MKFIICFSSFLVLINSLSAFSQNEILLHSGWKAKCSIDVLEDGTKLTSGKSNITGWFDAVVPGTVLTTLLKNNKIPDPFIGMNNELIPDIYTTGPAHYTYWFYNEFEPPAETIGKEVWLKFRGINYRADIYLNGRRVNTDFHEGMFLREKYLITHHFKKEGINRLAVLVEPPDPTGNPNGGQGGDGTIGRSVAMQCTAGWDWICPVRDRNTGIWDQVSLELTGPVDIRDPFIKTFVPGKRFPGQTQDPANISMSADLFNSSDKTIRGMMKIDIENAEWEKKVVLNPNTSSRIEINDLIIENPKIWWPNGLGSQPLYKMQISFTDEKNILSDTEEIVFGIRETGSYYDDSLGARIFLINGQKIFIKGGNWICSDALLRLSEERYEAEVKMHAEMNMNMIRVWGGAITERPEFYKACDKYGILVWQDLWISGDCNGRWLDPRKKESQARRREYPDDHSLFIRSVIDQVKMLRNHPSLYLWCGGNEYPPPSDINEKLISEIFPEFDNTRLYLDESTSPGLVRNETTGTADGPYGIQNIARLFTFRSFPFNPEIGSVGLPNIETLSKFIEKKDLNPPIGLRINPAWQYHKYLGYADFIESYGKITGIEDFCRKAQLVNYEQYRALQEGFNAHMWEWYSGMLVWKNQNPWTALRGQFYDVYLEQNGGFYGYMHAAKPLHIQLNFNDTSICLVNQTFFDQSDLIVSSELYDIHGALISRIKDSKSISANAVLNWDRPDLQKVKDEVCFLRLKLLDTKDRLVDENFYWISKPGKSYEELNELRTIVLKGVFNSNSNGESIVTVTNPNDETAFFIRLKVVDETNGDLALPVFFSDNYFTLLPREKKEIKVNCTQLSESLQIKSLLLEMDGWNSNKAAIKFKLQRK